MLSEVEETGEFVCHRTIEFLFRKPQKFQNGRYYLVH